MSIKEIKISSKKDGIYYTEGFGAWFSTSDGGSRYEVTQVNDALKTIEVMTQEERLVVLRKIEPVYYRLLQLLQEES